MSPQPCRIPNLSRNSLSEPMSVLNVAPNRKNADNLECALRHSHWSLLFATDIEEARKQLEREPIAVVLVDSSVPDTVRRELMRFTRGMPNPPGVVMLIPSEREDNLLDLLDEGALGVFGPDYIPAEIRSMVGEAGRGWHERHVSLQ